MGYNNIRRLRLGCEGMDAEERVENVDFVQVEFLRTVQSAKTRGCICRKTHKCFLIQS